MNNLPDYLQNNLKIVFVGYNPGEKSAQLGHHYAGRGNQFWRLLHDAQLTDRLYSPQEDKLLLNEGYGLTNIVSRPSKSSSDLTGQEMQTGAIELKAKIKTYQPKMVCFLGKEVYRKYAGLSSSTAVPYGLIEGEPVFPGIGEFVAPNPSGRSTIPYLEKLEVFKQLFVFTNQLSQNFGNK
jgi:mismatch-specific thymine-DNA glycosylase